MTIPNILTVIRILLLPVFWILALNDSSVCKWLALAVFIIASLTDMLDGRIARATGTVTNFGKIMDPLADKLLVISAMMVFVVEGRMAGYSLMIIIARELAITSLRVVAMSEGKVLAAAASGKTKTTIQMIYCILLLSGLVSMLSLPMVIESVAEWIVVAVTIWSGIDYFYKNRGIIKASIG